jgi:hypothetical protein
MGNYDEKEKEDAVRTARILAALEELARQRYDGHLTIMRFTTGWKVQLGTPDLLGGSGYAHVWMLPDCKDLNVAMAGALVSAGGQLPISMRDVVVFPVIPSPAEEGARS